LPRIPQLRLSRRQQEELVERYRAGALRRELAEAYGVSTGTVSNILKRNTATHPRGLGPDQLTVAVERYEQGDSLATIGAALATPANTVRTALLGRGITMRTTTGGP